MIGWGSTLPLSSITMAVSRAIAYNHNGHVRSVNPVLSVDGVIAKFIIMYPDAVGSNTQLCEGIFGLLIFCLDVEMF